MFINKLIGLVIILQLHICTSKRYSNYTLFRGVPVNDTHLEFFTNISKMYDVVYWRPPGKTYRPVDFLIGPDDHKSFLRIAEQNGVYLTTIIKDVQKAFDEQTVNTYVRRRMDSFNWQSYFRLDDIYSWLEDLSMAYPYEVKLESIGRTFENRSILAIRIVLKNSKIRSKVMIEGGIHAREWISPAFVTYMIYQILHAPSSEDENLKQIALSYEWYFIPVLNPDGYEYSHTEDRMWRKNRRNHHGVDINRNFGYGFGSDKFTVFSTAVGVSRDIDSDIFCGERAFSELESKALSDYLKSKGDDLEYYLGFHAYGQYIILPYAHLQKPMDNYFEVKIMGNRAANVIASKYKTLYTVGTAFETVGYMTSGVSSCWVKKAFGVPYVMTFELRDSGHYGFALPPTEILPTCKETMDGILSILTPRERFSKLNTTEYVPDGQGSMLMDKVVILHPPVYPDLPVLIHQREHTVNQACHLKLDHSLYHGNHFV